MPFTEPDVRVLFPVPLITVQLENCEVLNARLLEEIAARQQIEKGIDRSNRYGWHSATDLFERQEPAHAELARELDRVIAAATEKLIPDLPGDAVRRHEGWINVSPTNAMNAPHDHPGAFWSGCYYVQVPVSDDEEDKLSGALEFIDPRGSLGTTGRIETPFTRPKFSVRPTDGTCLLWPAFMKHWVHPNRASGERVSVAFNSWYGRGGKR